VKFDQVLAHGEGADLTVGAPLIDGAVVHATLIETRKGEKIKIFKKIRRQGYRRTRGHRQIETVLRVTGLEIGGKTQTWDGAVNFESKALRDAKARGLKHEVAALEALTPAPAVEESAPKKRVSVKAAVVEQDVEPAPAAEMPGAEIPVVVAPLDETPAAEAVTEAQAPAEAKPVAKAKASPKAKAEATSPEATSPEAPAAEAPPAEADDEPAAPKKKAAPKAKPASDDAE
jgi:large subunit ribosomal protein L21